MRSSGGRTFIIILAVLAIIVVGIEIATQFFIRPETNDAVTLSQIVSLPNTYDQDLINRLEDRQKYLLISKQEFVGNITTTVTPTPTN